MFFHVIGNTSFVEESCLGKVATGEDFMGYKAEATIVGGNPGLVTPSSPSIVDLGCKSPPVYYFVHGLLAASGQGSWK